MAEPGLGLGSYRLKFVDAHTHTSGPDHDGSPEDAVRMMDECGMEVAFCFAPMLQEVGPKLTSDSISKIRAANDYIAHYCSYAPERLYAFAALNPNPGVGDGDIKKAVKLMVEEAQRCYHELGIRGVGEMVADRWRAEDEELMPLWDKIAELGMYVVFHTGIFLDERSSTFCRPTYYEALHRTPNFHGHLAHLSWPWVDELIGALMMESSHQQGNGDDPWQLKTDFSFGAPPDWQVDCLKRALDALQPDEVIYGSDIFWPIEPQNYFQQYLLPHLSAFESAANLSRNGEAQGSPERQNLRHNVFYENVMSHWRRATKGLPQHPKRFAQTPKVDNARHGCC